MLLGTNAVLLKLPVHTKVCVPVNLELQNYRSISSYVRVVRVYDLSYSRTRTHINIEYRTFQLSRYSRVALVLSYSCEYMNTIYTYNTSIYVYYVRLT